MCCFYMVFHNIADCIEGNCPLDQHKTFYFIHCDNREVPGVCMLCIWLHLRDDLKLQCSVIYV